MKPDSAAINRFIRVARQGAAPGASTAEKTANKIAKALHKIGDDVCLLDGGVIDGICDMIRCMAGPWPTGECKDAVYEALKRAAR